MAEFDHELEEMLRHAAAGMETIPVDGPEGFVALAVNLAPVLEAAAKYRDQALTHGFSETAAEAMSVEFHDMVIHQVSHQLCAGAVPTVVDDDGE